MPLTQGGFQQLVTELRNYAEQHNVHIHDGLLVGLINYSKHLGVHELSDEDMLRVLPELGHRSLDFARQYSKPANGAALQHVLLEAGCSECFGNCSRAAEQILQKEIPIESFGSTFHLEE